MASVSTGGLLGLQSLYGACKPIDYFTDENVKFLQDKLKEMLKRDFGWDVHIPKPDIVRVQQRVFEERYESIPRMNQRVLMYISNDYRVHQLEKTKHLKWEEGYYWSQQLYNPLAKGVMFDPSTIKIPNRLGKADIGGRLMFRPVN